MAKSNAKKETPLMKQYNAIKAKYPGALLLFRVGDFYETFGADAVAASEILDIVLTKRANGAASHVELAGFPHHALDTYLPKLVRSGKRVAICDQLEDPKSVKGIVKRGVTELVTPGLSFHDNVLDQRRNNYLASYCCEGETTGIAFLDLSTGEFLVGQGKENYIAKIIQGFQPAEILFRRGMARSIEDRFGGDYNSHALDEWVYEFDFGYEKLNRHFKTQSLKGYGIEDMHQAIIAAGAIMHYLEVTEHRDINHITSVSRIEEENHMWLDRFTVRNLELLASAHSDGTPLIKVLDHVATPMGSRMLRRWMVLPLISRDDIVRRHEVVSHLLVHDEASEMLTAHLGKVGDLERLAGKVSTGRIAPRELVQLKRGLSRIGPIRDVLSQETSESISLITNELDPMEELITYLGTHLMEDAPLQVAQGNVIASGISEELDELRTLAYSGKDYLLQIQKREAERTGITSLKIAYNKVFGYYLEVTNAHKDKVPQEWIRKQTLVNAERYVTEELKTYEEKILKAESQLSSIENKIYLEVVAHVATYIQAIQRNAQQIGHLDCLVNFAHVSRANDYTCPTLTDDNIIDIKAGRHPVIERLMPPGEAYIPNDVFLDSDSQQIMIITGPNMAGKSALLRQTALIVLMAQIGCFVPAGHARLGITDKIFTRVGAADNLSRGESTFMVEMTETASILNNLSSKSLVIMDEIGRGTSTYDGISIAWSIVEHLHNHEGARAKTLFATHYHELNELAQDLGRVKNFNVAVKEIDNKVIFLRKLQEGGSEHSFGIHVAQMAGMPNEVVIRSNEILRHLEKEKVGNSASSLGDLPSQNFQLNLFEADPRIEQIMQILREVNINTIAPVEALLKLNELKDLLTGRDKD